MNLLKFRPLFLLISISLIITSVFSILRYRFKTSIDFAGGTIWELSLKDNPQDQIRKVFQTHQISLSSLSTNQDSHLLLKFKNINLDQKQALETELKQLDPDFQEHRFETLGPSLGQELLKKTVYSIILSSLFLLLFIANRFKDISFGLSAILAMFHDSFILIGVFSLLGHFFGAEIDTLFVTAVLTTLSASVHDTVVTFDRIRELKTKDYRASLLQLANQAVNETLVRSINNSMTIIFMLLALAVLGGPTTRWFAVALLVGAVLGTYSSLAVAIPLVLVFKKNKT